MQPEPQRNSDMTPPKPETKKQPAFESEPSDKSKTDEAVTLEKDAEIGGPKGPEPTRFGDWEQKGRCSDF